MKTETISYLSTNFDRVNKLIEDYNTSLKVGIELNKNNPKDFTKESLDILRSRISIFEESKQEIISCINWVKSI